MVGYVHRVKRDKGQSEIRVGGHFLYVISLYLVSVCEMQRLRFVDKCDLTWLRPVHKASDDQVRNPQQ
jgi:hypothetical protein